MARPRFRITCCLCEKAIPQSSDVNALDEEWQRRFPKMVGILACNKCVLRSKQWDWSCQGRNGTCVDGHRPAANTRPNSAGFCDSWRHVEYFGTHVALVWLYPWSGLLQGAEQYLRHTVQHARVRSEPVQHIQDALTRWDAVTGMQGNQSIISWWVADLRPIRHGAP